MKIEAQVDHLERSIPHLDLYVPRVSAGTVGWHIAHSLLTINIIIEALKRSDPQKYKWSFNLPRVLVFTINKIPRGRAKAPSVVRPPENFTQDSLKDEVAIIKAKLEELTNLSEKHFFEHPFFGHVKLKPAKKFLRLHTAHHLSIIGDIMKLAKIVDDHAAKA